MKSLDVVFVILAQKGGNDLIRNPLEPFGNDQVPLIIWKIRQLRRVANVKEIYVSTFSSEVKRQVVSEGVLVHDRRRDFEEENDVPIGTILTEIASDIHHDHIAWVSPVSPFMNEYDYSLAIDKYMEHVVQGDSDSLIAVNKLTEYLWDDHGPMNYLSDGFQQKRFELDALYRVTNGLFIRSRKDTIDRKYFVGETPFKFLVSKLAALDINSHEELEIGKGLHDVYLSQKRKREAVVFLDFDGVVFDSAPEAYAIALLASQKINTLAELRLKSSHAERFFAQRHLIGPAWNYYYLLKAIENNSDQNFASYLPEEPGNEALNFQTVFFATRHVIRNNFWDEWLALNSLYPGSEYFIELLNSEHNIAILTTKDKPTVEALLKRHGLAKEVPIYDAVSYQEYGSKANFMDQYISEYGVERALFVDDSKGHIEKAGWVGKLVCLQAKWGYVTEQDRLDNKQEVFDAILSLFNR